MASTSLYKHGWLFYIPGTKNYLYTPLHRRHVSSYGKMSQSKPPTWTLFLAIICSVFRFRNKTSKEGLVNNISIYANIYYLLKLPCIRNNWDHVLPAFLLLVARRPINFKTPFFFSFSQDRQGDLINYWMVLFGWTFLQYTRCLAIDIYIVNQRIVQLINCLFATTIRRFFQENCCFELLLRDIESQFFWEKPSLVFPNF